VVSAAIAGATRGWRDVITDLKCAVPDAEICVLPFEASYGAPEMLLHKTCKLDLPVQGGHDWLRKSPNLRQLRAHLAERGDAPDLLPDADGPWQPFGAAQRAQMQEKFQDDLFWLAAGAGGLATTPKEALPGGRGKAHRLGPTRGQTDAQEGHVEQTG